MWWWMDRVRTIVVGVSLALRAFHIRLIDELGIFLVQSLYFYVSAMLCSWLGTIPRRTRYARWIMWIGFSTCLGFEVMVVAVRPEFLGSYDPLRVTMTIRRAFTIFSLFTWLFCFFFPPTSERDHKEAEGSVPKNVARGYDGERSVSPLKILIKLENQPSESFDIPEEENEYRKEIKKEASDNQLDFFSPEFAQRKDSQDELAEFRGDFHIPFVHPGEDGSEVVYFCGNSLGLLPKATEDSVLQDIRKWRDYGVRGHFLEPRPWFEIEKEAVPAMAEIVGAFESEIAVMNSLTVNLHLLMVSFYRPNSSRFRILIESEPFPSDMVAFQTHIESLGRNPDEVLLEISPRAGEYCVRTTDIIEILEKEGSSIALVLLSGVQFRTGQFFEMKCITEAGHEAGCMVGWDLAHAAGNIDLKLHDWNVDFACWCTYKYLCGGPGNLSGIFVHQRHHDKNLPRYAGWWANKRETRFLCQRGFDADVGAAGWQLSNPIVLGMASLIPSLDIYRRASMDKLRQKSFLLTAYLELLLDEKLSDMVEIMTPRDPNQRGCQLSIRIVGLFDGEKLSAEQIEKRMLTDGFIVDKRNEDIIRVAPKPIYNTFEDVYRFVEYLTRHVSLR